MKIAFIDLFRSAFVKKDKKFRQRLVIFLTCLFIAVIIWFTIKLSAEYDIVIEMPVTFTQLPSKKVLTFTSDTVLQVEVMEKGSRLFKMLYLNDIKPVTISLRFLPLYPKNGVYYGVITPFLLINEIEREKNLLGKIISISPDSIYLSFEPEKTKKMPVSANFDLTFEKQFMKYGNITFSPDSVTVKGPENIVDNMESASLGDIRFEMLNQNHTGEKAFPKDSLYQNLVFMPSSVSYSIPVEKYTEAEAEVPVSIISNEEIKARIFPDKVKVYYTVALKDYAKIENGMMHAFADLSTINLVSDDRVKVNLESYPSFIRINKIEPEKVEFIIIK